MTAQAQEPKELFYTCTAEGHETYVCARTTRGWTQDEQVRLPTEADGKEVTSHHWTAIQDPTKPKELGVSSTVDPDQYINTEIPAFPERWYCHLYDHRGDACAVSGYSQPPQGSHAEGRPFTKGKRSVYIRYTIPSLDDIMDEQRITTGEYLHGKDSGKIFTHIGNPTDDLNAARADAEQQAFAADLQRRADAAPKEASLYIDGDWVTIRAKLVRGGVGDEHLKVRVEDKKGFITLEAPYDSVMGKTEPPAPREPDRALRLITDSLHFETMVFTWTTNPGAKLEGWVEVRSDAKDPESYMEWPYLWAHFAPFTTYVRTGRVE